MFSGIVGWVRAAGLLAAIATGPVAMDGQGVGPSVLEVSQNAERTQIVIIGTGFGTSAPYVSLSGTNLSVVSYSDRQITAKLPVGLTAGSYPLRVVNSRTGAAARYQAVVGMMEGQVSSGIPEPDGGAAAVGDVGTVAGNAVEAKPVSASPTVSAPVMANSGVGTAWSAASSMAVGKAGTGGAGTGGTGTGGSGKTRAGGGSARAAKVRQPVVKLAPVIGEEGNSEGGQAVKPRTEPVNEPERMAEAQIPAAPRKSGKAGRRRSEGKLQARLEGALGPVIGDGRGDGGARSSARRANAGTGRGVTSLEASETARLTGALGPIEGQSSATSGVGLPGMPGIAGLLGALNPVEPTGSDKAANASANGAPAGGAVGAAGGGGVGVRSKGPFDAATSYGASDVVSYNGFFYVALSPVSAGGSSPDQGGGWHVLARETDVDAGLLKTAAPSELELAGSLSLSGATGPVVGDGLGPADALIGALGP